MSVTIELHTKPEGNSREHWRKVQQRAKSQKLIVGHVLKQHTPPALPAVITMTRLSFGEMDDDNLRSALKRVRDAVADWCGCGDSPRDPLRWEYGQEKTKRGHHAVRIEWRSDGA